MDDPKDTPKVINGIVVDIATTVHKDQFTAQTWGSGGAGGVIDSSFYGGALDAVNLYGTGTVTIGSIGGGITTSGTLVYDTPPIDLGVLPRHHFEISVDPSKNGYILYDDLTALLDKRGVAYTNASLDDEAAPDLTFSLPA